MTTTSASETGPGISFRRLVSRVWDELDRDNVAGLAAQMSYYFALALFPFLIFLAALVGSLPFTGLWDKLLKWIVLYLPPPSQHLIFDTVTSLTVGHRSFLSLGLLGTAWASCAGLMNCMCSLNVAFEVKERRSFLRRLSLAFGMVFVFAFLFIGSFALLTLGDWLDSWLAIQTNLSVPLLALWRAGRWIVSLGLVAVAISLVYYTLPNLDCSWRLITPGAVFVVLASIPASLGFNLYVRYVASYDKTYGALGAFMVLMVWIYMGSLITLVGAEINCEVHKMRTEMRRSSGERSGEAANGNMPALPYGVPGPDGPQS